MDSSILPLRSFALLSLPAILAFPGFAPGASPAPGGGPVVRGPDSSVEDTTSRDRGAAGEVVLTQNWYAYFCGPGWDPDTTVPCGRHGIGAPFHGCANSASALGARLNIEYGDAAEDDVVLISTDEPPTALSIVLQGPSRSTSGLVFGDGVRCVNGPLKRLYKRNAVSGVMVAPIAGERSIRVLSASLGDPIPSPSSRYYQVWYRDGPGHFNISSALQIDWP